VTRRANTASRGSARKPGATRFGKSRNASPWFVQFVRVLREIAPQKPSVTLHIWTGLSIRQCENIVAGGGTSIEVVRACLATEHGWKFLRALMGDPAPAWFREIEFEHDSVRAKADLAAARRRARELQRKRKR
jgi:hypothetical protein